MKAGCRIVISLCIMLILFIGCGCVAQKSSVHPTLKGDNSVEPAMVNSGDLPESGFVTLSELTDRFAKELAHEVSGRKIYFDRANIRDVNTGDVANFSSYLQNEMDASLSKTFYLQVLPDKADILLGAEFQKYGNQIKVFFKYHTPDFQVNKSLDYGIERDRLPKDSLKENLRSKAYQLAANIIDDDLERKIYIKPFEATSCNCISQFSRTFSTLVKTQIAQMHRQVAIIDEKPVKEKLTNTRAIKAKAREIKVLASSDAVFADADTVLEGEYTVNSNQVMVTLFLKDLEGQLLNSSEVDIDRSIITIPLEDETSAKLAEITDRKNEAQQNAVKLSTTHGGAYPVYQENEKIVFYAQVQEPLFLYIYDIDSRENVTLLYPYSPDIRHLQTYPGRLLVIPEERDDFEFVVASPFGKDAVKVFASPLELPIPTLNSGVATQSFRGGTRAIDKRRKQIQGQLAAEKMINPRDLVDFYRGLANRFNIDIYEDTIEVETRR